MKTYLIKETDLESVVFTVLSYARGENDTPENPDIVTGIGTLVETKAIIERLLKNNRLNIIETNEN